MMIFLTSLQVAWRGLITHKLRSFLTLLGMVIGVSVVIAIVSLGEGLRILFAGEIGRMGSNIIYIMPKEVMRSGQVHGEGGVELFKTADVSALKRNTTLLSSVQAGMRVPRQVKYKDKTYQAFIEGGDVDWFEASGIKIAEGKTFTQADYDGRKRVVVIGANIKKKLFPKFVNPIGEIIKIGESNFTVIGVMKESKGMGNITEDDFCVVPLTTLQERITGSDDVFYILARVKEGADMEQAKREVHKVLRARRHTPDPTKANYELTTPEDWLEFGNRFVNILVMVFGVIGAISLLVGGIGIMNIMLVSVTERTREIGLRMALGASRPVVLLQFLIEACVLTVVGGGMGLLLGWAFAFGIGALLEKLIKVSWTPTIPYLVAIITLIISAFVGIIFGIYPAYRASRLDPIEALRYE